MVLPDRWVDPLHSNPVNDDQDFDDVVAQLVHRHRVVPGLENIKRLMTGFGNVHEALEVIHVAGTNGKGSVSHKIAYVLEEIQTTSEMRIGLFTSPHSITILERISINGTKISKKNFVRLYQRIISQPGQDNPSTAASFFDIITAMALLYFYEGPSCDHGYQSEISEQITQRQPYCNLVVLETGLGGLYDPTNIIPRPLCSVITSIGWDHMTYLGAKELQCEPIILVPNSNLTETFDEENQRTARAVLQVLAPKLKISSPSLHLLEASKRWLTKPPFRLYPLTEEELKIAEQTAYKILDHHNPSEISQVPSYVYLDVGHNETAIERVIREIITQHPGKPLYILCCLSRERQLSVLSPIANLLLPDLRGNQREIHTHSADLLSPKLRGIYYLTSMNHRTRTLSNILLDINTSSDDDISLRLINYIRSSTDDLETNLLPAKFRVNQSLITLGQPQIHNEQNADIRAGTSPKQWTNERFSASVAAIFKTAAEEDAIMLFIGTVFMMREVSDALGLPITDC